MKINRHGNLIRNGSEGNGFHGRCEHCGLACVTDLGYSSWEGTTCVYRDITSESDMPENVRSYASFSGYRWDSKKLKFIKPTFDKKLDHLTLDQMVKRVEKLITS